MNFTDSLALETKVNQCIIWVKKQESSVEGLVLYSSDTGKILIKVLRVMFDFKNSWELAPTLNLHCEMLMAALI